MPHNTARIQKQTLVTQLPFFYGWVILAVGTLGVIMTSPGQTYAVSIFIEHFIQDLGVSRSLVSTLYAAGTLVGSFALPFVGREIDRRGTRVMVVVIAGIFGLACIYMGFVRGALTLALGFVAIRMFGQGSLSLVSQNAINQWWVQRRGTILGLSGLFVSLLGLGAFPALINWLIPQIGWRLTYPLLGALLLLVMAPLGFLFLRDRPELYGLEPDGRRKSGGGVEDAPPSAPDENWTRGEALRTPTFWIVTGGVATSAMMGTGLFFHMVSIFADNGLSADVAASVYLPIAATTAIVNLGSGALVDRIPLRFALSVALVLLAAALWGAQYLATVPLAFLYGVTLGASTGLYRSVAGVAWANYFGRQHLGSISGTATTI
ncbi:MAG: MFS transporter, partial [Candidatus Promineifilaceae bacterium]|nr:MFS transporter [Candidatus Promineifilaceae bacterium]